MNKYTIFVGVDVSKDNFDTYDFNIGHQQYINEVKGFKSFCKSLVKESCVVMEATGSYHQQLALYLYESGISVSIVNPLSVKRFIQMKLRKNKTDKSDAKMIAYYGKEQKPGLWEPTPEYISMCRMIQKTIGLYLKQQTAIKNQLHSLKSKGIESGKLVRSLKRQRRSTDNEINKLEDENAKLLNKHESELFTNLQSIPGIGKKTAMLLISGTNAFSTFENHKQVSSYLGLAPMEYSSGSSINKKITDKQNGRCENTKSLVHV